MDSVMIRTRFESSIEILWSLELGMPFASFLFTGDTVNQL